MSAPAELTAHARQLRDEAPFIWLYEVELLTAPATRLRVTNAGAAVQFGFDSSGSPLTYEPAPIVHGPIEQSAEGDQPQMQVQFGNAGLELAQLLEDLTGLDGSRVVVRFVNAERLDDAASQVEFHAVVLGIRADAQRVSVNLGMNSLQNVPALRERFMRFHCRFQYGSAGCGAQTGNAALLALVPSCPRTLAGCETVGAAEASLSLPVLHPLRWGGWSGIPRRSS